MEESLLRKLSPKLGKLGSGGYERVFRLGGRTYRSSLHLAVAEILSLGGGRIREGVLVPGSNVRADFSVEGKFIFVDRTLSETERSSLGDRIKDCLLVVRSQTRSDMEDSGLAVVRLGDEDLGGLQTIFLDDPSFNFDYAHILPNTQKCSVMHGHTSSVLVEIVGRPVDGMVVDFGDAKEIVRGAVRGLDHKLFINERYVTRESPKSVTLRFRTVHGDFAIQAPKGTTVLLSGEATVENLAREVLGRISPGMPDNVVAVGVYVYEGLNKGSHLLAYLHANRGASPRRRR